MDMQLLSSWWASCTLPPKTRKNDDHELHDRDVAGSLQISFIKSCTPMSLGANIA